MHERLELALGELDDPLLHGLWVHAVRPAAGTATLVVELVTPDAACLQETHARLAAARRWLRAEIAAAIQRKRTPELLFVVAPDGSPPPLSP